MRNSNSDDGKYANFTTPSSALSQVLGLQFAEARIASLESEVAELKLELKQMQAKLLTSVAAAAKLEEQVSSMDAIEANQKDTITFLKFMVEKK